MSIETPQTISSQADARFPPKADGEELEPGHVDFVLHISETLEQRGANVRNAMPVSKLISILMLVSAVILVALGLNMLVSHSYPSIASLLAENVLSLLMLASGIFCLVVVLRSTLFFLQEILDLAH